MKHYTHLFILIAIFSFPPNASAQPKLSPGMDLIGLGKLSDAYATLEANIGNLTNVSKTEN